MNINAIICTRSRDAVSKTTDNLLKFLVSCGIKVYLMSEAKSIFSAYQGAFEKLNPDNKDIMIFCHDDIEIRENPEEFIQKIYNLTRLPETGFIGPAGTTFLGPECIWWDQKYWREGKHKGKVYHISPQGQEYETFYGEPEDVVVLDGLFLAARSEVLRDIELKKPEFFEGEWDFYDIYYTSQAFLKGYNNRILDINIVHNSRGELVGRESWHKNREAFIQKNDLPIQIKN